MLFAIRTSLFAIVTTVLVPASVSLASVLMTGKIYSEGARDSAPLFHYLRESHAKNEIHVKFTSGSGALVAEEKIVFKDAGVVEYTMEQFQVKQKSTIVVGPKKVKMLFEENGEKPDKNEFKKPKNFLLPPMITEYLQKIWPRIKGGERHKVKLAVPHMNTYFTFSYRLKEGHTDLVYFRATNFFVDLVAEPLKLWVDAETGQTLKAKGPSLLYEKKGRKLKAFVGLSQFEYPKMAP